MLRRYDYSVNVAGGFRASQLISDYVEASGIYLPTKLLHVDGGQSAGH